MQANDLRRGIVIIFNGDLCKVMEFHHHTPGNLRAMVQAKLRNMRTGNQFEHRFRSQDEIEQAYINQHEMEYLYSDGHAHHFMNTENYEQVEISEEDLGDAAVLARTGREAAGAVPRDQADRHRAAEDASRRRSPRPSRW